ncbi:MAG TPA: DUF4097 family beta strand repeat-containing protein [Actinophytocola sp.]|nr:DUF4097 family beta strand repeat-containing protein [Actinophytocola sp.]
MPVFETPQPVSLTIDLGIGDTRLHADDRSDTVVDVRPSDPGSDADVKAAEAATVEFVSGKLLVKAPKQRNIFGKAGSVDVTVDLPAGSDVRGVAREMAFRGTGRLGECRFKTSTGDIQLELTGPLVAATSVGDIMVDRVDGPADASTGSGTVRIRELGGPAMIKNSNGGISVDKAHAAVEAKAANGDIRIGEVVRGSVVLGTSIGQLEVGISAGTAAKLDVRSVSGSVHNFMTAVDGPEPDDEVVEVYANTTVGDVTIRRV